ncbi:AMP-binding protein [Acidianus manzaensis]|uniref:AMP-dependent synthetase n=1 Tax=Acidianus manzaensis TaxID=282676 RepID=A0A1W6JZ04_9CREN|nr:AMP-binding protein [Acidianus manzaensis]ARM75440.1 hypothetical protein B6F84_04950 [Acidianus manzaensis]
MIKSKNKFDIRVFGSTYEEIRKNFVWPQKFNFIESVDENSGIALIEDSKEIKYQEIKERSNGVSKFLKELGVKKGDIVAGMLPQGFNLLSALLGSYKNGSIYLSMSILFGTDAIKFRLNHSKASVVFTTSEYVKKIKEVYNTIIVSDDGGDYNYDDIEKVSIIEYNEVKENEPIHLFYTSGTTGEPKGVLLPKSWILGHLPAWQISLDFPKEKEIFITPAEWAWIGGLGDLVLPALYYGNTVITYKRQGKFDPIDFLDVLENYKVNGTFMVPTAIRMLKNHENEVKKYNLELKAIISGGEVVNPDLITWTKNNMNTDLNQIYGQTEANLVICNSPLIMKVKPEYTGPECPGHKVLILDEEGKEVTNTIGEIAIKLPDPSAMIEYYKNPDATKLKIKNNILFTGDMGYIDNEGYIKFVGRKDDIVKVSGYRLSALEIENEISKHPSVASCAVVDIQDKIRGSIIVAFIVPKEGYKPDINLENEIKTFVKNKLATYAYPRFIFFVDDLPKTVTGKLRRVELRKLAEKMIEDRERSSS